MITRFSSPILEPVQQAADLPASGAEPSPPVGSLLGKITGFFASKLRLAKVDSLLKRAEHRIEQQLGRFAPRRFADEINPAAIERELHCYEEVDSEAKLVALALASWYRYGVSSDFPVLRNHLCEPVLLRIRDARRYLAENHSVPLGWAQRPDRLVAELLIERWHVYAEKYWKERWLKASLG
jgi:hypothetical protein